MTYLQSINPSLIALREMESYPQQLSDPSKV